MNDLESTDARPEDVVGDADAKHKRADRDEINKRKIERARLMRLAAEAGDIDLQRELLVDQQKDVLLDFEAQFQKSAKDAGGQVQAQAKDKAARAAKAWLDAKIAKLTSGTSKKDKVESTEEGEDGQKPEGRTDKEAPQRFEQHAGMIARACAHVAELEGAIAVVLGRHPDEREFDELMRRRSVSDAEEHVTVNGDEVVVRSLVGGKSIETETAYLCRQSLWPRRSGVVHIKIAEAPKTLQPLRGRLTSILSHAGIVAMSRAAQDTVVAQCVLEMAIPIVWLESDRDDGFELLHSAILVEDKRSFTAGALAEVRGALSYVDHLIVEISRDREVLKLRAQAARDEVAKDERTPLPNPDPVISRIEERCTRELNHYIEWACEQMHSGLGTLAARIKRHVLQEREELVVNVSQAPSQARSQEPSQSQKQSQKQGQEQKEKGGDREEGPDAKEESATVTVSNRLVDVVAAATGVGSVDTGGGIMQLQQVQADLAKEFWGKHLRDRIIKQSLMSMPTEALVAIVDGLEKESFRAVDKASEDRLRIATIDAFRTAIAEQVLPIEIPAAPTHKASFGYMKKVSSSVMGAIGAPLVVMTMLGFGIGAITGEAGLKGTLYGFLVGVVLTIVTYFVAESWVKRDYLRAKYAAATKLRLATIKVHAGVLDKFEGVWRKSFAVNLKASLRDTLRRVKDDLREHTAKTLAEEKQERSRRADEAGRRELQVAKLDAVAAQATRLRAQFLEQHKQLVKLLEKAIAKEASP